MNINDKGWSKWYDFEELFTFEGLVDPNDDTGMTVFIEGKKGSLAKWDGFLEKEDSDIDFEKRKLAEQRATRRLKGELPSKDAKGKTGSKKRELKITVSRALSDEIETK